MFDILPLDFRYQASVVQKADNAIHRINSIHWIEQLVSLILIHWIVIYPVHSAIHLLNNRGQMTNGHFRVPKTVTFKMRLGAQPFLWKWVLFAWERKTISISKAEHLPSFWNRGPWELGNGLFFVFDISLLGMYYIAYKMKRSFLRLTYYFSVFGYQMKHYFSCLINQLSFSGHQIKIPFLNLVRYFLRLGVSILIGWNTPRVSKNDLEQHLSTFKTVR